MREVIVASGPNPNAPRPEPEHIHFHRTELTQILSVYGRGVAAGHWRDYAIDALKDVAVFSIFLRASQMPVFRIEKRPKLARRQGAYAVISASGQVLRRGQDLAQVLRVFDRKWLRVVGE